MTEAEPAGYADIVQTLPLPYDAVRNDAVRTTAYALIEAEPDQKYRKKDATFWR